jgi:hypothetical protein
MPLSARNTSAAAAPTRFVPVNERVVLNDVKQVCGGHLKHICVQELSAKHRLWHGRSRLQ